MKRVGLFFKRQWQTKTGCSAILGIVGAGISVATGTVPVAVGIVAAWAALQTMFLRDRDLVKDNIVAAEVEAVTGEKPISDGG